MKIVVSHLSLSFSDTLEFLSAKPQTDMAILMRGLLTTRYYFTNTSNDI